MLFGTRTLKSYAGNFKVDQEPSFAFDVNNEKLANYSEPLNKTNLLQEDAQTTLAGYRDFNW